MGTEIGELARELSATNPWWRDPDGWAATDPDLRDAAGHDLQYSPDVLEDLQPGALYLLRGPRRVGKTVAVKRKVASLIDAGVPPRCIVWASVDGWAAKDVRTMVQNTAMPPLPDGHVRWWFLDEISATDGDWGRHVKWLRDNHVEFRDGCVVLTGSDAGELTRAAGTLAGRRGAADNVDRTLLPMGFATFVQLLHDGKVPTVDLPLAELHAPAGAEAYFDLLPWLDDLVCAWDIYLQYGGFPTAVAAAMRAEPVPEQFLADLGNVIHRDAFAGSRLSTTKLASLLERLWTAMAAPANLSNIAGDVDVAPPTVTRHVEYLRDAYLAWTCPQRQDDEWQPRDRAQDKIYAIDPLVARLAHLRNGHREDVDPTVLTEMMLGVALRRAQLRTGRLWADDASLFYVRTPARKEIDFVSADLGGAAVEGKYTDGGAWRREAATVNASEWRGVLATRSVLDLNNGPQQAWAVPAALLAYAVDN